MRKIFAVMDLMVSLVFIILGVVNTYLTKNVFVSVSTFIAYVIWEVIVFYTFRKVKKFLR